MVSLMLISLARYMSIFHFSLTTRIDEDILYRVLLVLNTCLNVYFVGIYIALPGEYNDNFKICYGQSINDPSAADKKVNYELALFQEVRILR